MEKLLLHICCAPDATYAIEYFGINYDLIGYFYDPNIHPEEEYRLRLKEMEKLSNTLSFTPYHKGTGFTLYEGEYDPERWFALTKRMEEESEGGKRCEVCFRMRLEKSASFAKTMGIDLFSTILTISPHKDAKLINSVGQEIANRFGLRFLEADLKKKDGFKKSIILSKKYGLYRQSYCGCIYSRAR